MTKQPKSDGQSFKDHFSKAAGLYAQFRPTYPDAMLQFVAAQTGAAKAAWDAGCGSGQLSVKLADYFDEVIATDASQAQINAATPHDRVRYLCVPAEKSGLASQSVDLVIAAQAAHWFDREAYYEEARRVLRPRGFFAMVGYGTIEGDHVAAKIAATIYNQVLGAYWPPERRYVENAYRDFDFPFAEIDTPNWWLEANWSHEQLMGYILSWSAVRQWEAATGKSALDMIKSEFKACQVDADLVQTYRWPLFMRAGRL